MPAPGTRQPAHNKCENQGTRREIEERYEKLGKRLYHKAIVPPRVILWNHLREDVWE